MTKYRFAWFVGGSALLCLFFVSLSFGAVSLSFYEVFNGLLEINEKSMSIASRILVELRLPRAILAIIVGASLALVGALLQTSTRNDLADPFLFGLSSGASVGAVLIITKFGDVFGIWSLPIAAFCGGVLSASAVMVLFFMQKKRGHSDIVLCGLAISFLFGAITSFLVYSGDQRAANSILFWTLGGLGLARWDNLIFPFVGMLCLVVLIFKRYRELDTLLVGEQTALSLGINVRQLQVEIFLCCAFCTASIVALTGVIGFIGLMVPHIVRPYSSVNHKLALPLVGIWGAVLLLFGDVMSRTILAPQELPVGIVTAGLGGMFVLYLILRKPTKKI
jgi:iron complex transport system permease protein